MAHSQHAARGPAWRARPDAGAPGDGAPGRVAAGRPGRVRGDHRPDRAWRGGLDPRAVRASCWICDDVEHNDEGD